MVAVAAAAATTAGDQALTVLTLLNVELLQSEYATNVFFVVV